MTDRILCDAIVDPLKGEPGNWLVTVTGAGAAKGKVRIYALQGKTEDDAAKAGIAAFVEEMSR